MLLLILVIISTLLCSHAQDAAAAMALSNNNIIDINPVKVNMDMALSNTNMEVSFSNTNNNMEVAFSNNINVLDNNAEFIDPNDLELDHAVAKVSSSIAISRGHVTSSSLDYNIHAASIRGPDEWPYHPNLDIRSVGAFDYKTTAPTSIFSYASSSSSSSVESIESIPARQHHHHQRGHQDSSNSISTVSLNYNIQASDRRPDEWPSKPEVTSKEIISFDYETNTSSSSSATTIASVRKHHHGHEDYHARHHHRSHEHYHQSLSTSTSSEGQVYPEVSSYLRVSGGVGSGPEEWPAPNLKESIHSEATVTSTQRGRRRRSSASSSSSYDHSSQDFYYSSCETESSAYKVASSNYEYSTVRYATVSGEEGEGDGEEDGEYTLCPDNGNSSSWCTVSESMDDTNGSEAHIPEDLIISTYTIESSELITAYALDTVTTVGTSGTTWITSYYPAVLTSGTTWISSSRLRTRRHHHRSPRTATTGSATITTTDVSLSVLPSYYDGDDSLDSQTTMGKPEEQQCGDISVMPYRPTHHVLESDEMLFSRYDAWTSASPGSDDYYDDDDEYESIGHLTSGYPEEEDSTSFQESSYDSFDSEFDAPDGSRRTSTTTVPPLPTVNTATQIRTRRTSITETFTKDGRCQTMTITATVRTKDVFITVPTAIRSQQRSSKLFKHKAYNALFFHLRSVLEMCDCTRVDVLPQPDHREGSVIEVVGYRPDGSACFEAIERRAIVIANMFDHVRADFFRSANQVLMIRLRRVKDRHRYPLYCPVSRTGGIHCSDLGLLYSKRNCPALPLACTTTGS